MILFRGVGATLIAEISTGSREEQKCAPPGEFAYAAAPYGLTEGGPGFREALKFWPSEHVRCLGTTRRGLSDHGIVLSREFTCIRKGIPARTPDLTAHSSISVAG